MLPAHRSEVEPTTLAKEPGQTVRPPASHFCSSLKASGFPTTTGARLAKIRHDRLRRFLDGFTDEI